MPHSSLDDPTPPLEARTDQGCALSVCAGTRSRESSSACLWKPQSHPVSVVARVASHTRLAVPVEGYRRAIWDDWDIWWYGLGGVGTTPASCWRSGPVTPFVVVAMGLRPVVDAVIIITAVAGLAVCESFAPCGCETAAAWAGNPMDRRT